MVTGVMTSSDQRRGKKSAMKADSNAVRTAKPEQFAISEHDGDGSFEKLPALLEFVLIIFIIWIGSFL